MGDPPHEAVRAGPLRPPRAAPGARVRPHPAQPVPQRARPPCVELERQPHPRHRGIRRSPVARRTDDARAQRPRPPSARGRFRPPPRVHLLRPRANPATRSSAVSTSTRPPRARSTPTCAPGSGLPGPASMPRCTRPSTNGCRPSGPSTRSTTCRVPGRRPHSAGGRPARHLVGPQLGRNRDGATVG